MVDYKSFGLQDVLGSPFYSVADTASNLPFVNQTGFGDWLHTAPLTQGVRNFQDQHPGWATATDIAASFVPYAGWGGALAKAGLEGGDLLAATNRLGRGAAGLFPRNQALAFAAGETARYAPLAGGLTAFDTLGGRYDNPIDAAASFGLGSLAGVGIMAGGHALTPLIERVAPEMIGGAWKAAFDPGPELSALYGFSDNQRAAARKAAGVPQVQQATDPVLAPQQRAAVLWDLRNDVKNAQATAATGGAVADPRLLEVDPGLLDSQYDTETRSILTQELEPVDSPFQWSKGAATRKIRQTVDSLFRNAPSRDGARVTVPITANGKQPTNPDVLAASVGLPPDWLHNVIFPRITQTTLKEAIPFKLETGLTPHPSNKGFRLLDTTRADGKVQQWAVRQEADDGAYLMITQVPGEQRMTGRANYPQTKDGDFGEPARAFFSFKTNDPGKFIPELRHDFDTVERDPELAYNLRDRVPRGQSDFLDKAMDFRDIYLSRKTIQEFYNAMLTNPGKRQTFTKEILGGPVAGKEIAQFIETYAAPTTHQLKESPEGRGTLGLYQALFDAAEGRKNRILHGLASIPDDKTAISALFSPANVDDNNALVVQLRKLVETEPDALETLRKVVKGDGSVDPKSLIGTPVGEYLKLLGDTTDVEIAAINKPIGILRGLKATDARQIAMRKFHFGISRGWDGSVFVPIYKAGAVEPDAVVAGGSIEHAEKRAKDWMDARKNWLAENGKPAETRRTGKPYISGQNDDIPGFIKNSAMNPGLLEPRAGMMGYEHQYEPYKHVDDFIKELEENLTRRWRYGASTVGDALTVSQMNKLARDDPHAYDIVKSRVAQMKGQPGPWEQIQNRIADKVLARTMGTNSASKAAEATNELMFHAINGAGNVATPILNLTSVLQTHLPEGVNFLTSDPAILKGFGYHFPRFDAEGKPAAGFNVLTDPIGLLWGGFRNATSGDPATKEFFNALYDKKIMGASLANEYTGQDRTIAARLSEGIRGPEDYTYWAKRASSLMMSKTEQISRTLSAGMALEAMNRWERIHGVKFTMDQKIANATKMVHATNYGYFKWDRPQMFTTPLGSVFGNQKTWMTNYLFMLGHYLGLGVNNKNWLPLLTSLGTTAALGGAFAVPFLGQAADTISQIFNHKNAQQYLYDQMGEGGNAISFGFPGLLGLSLQGQVSAPGSNLAHDASFFTSIVAVSRAQLLARAVGRAYDDQIGLGLNPFRDRLFQQQAAQALAPRAMYRAWESLMSDQIKSASSGYPMIKNLGWGSRVLRGLGFSTADIDLQYSAYEHLLADKTARSHQIALLSQAYAQAAIERDAGMMQQILQRITVSGLDINDVMRAAQGRMHDAGFDMFGRNFNSQQLDQYNAMLDAGNRRRQPELAQ